MLLSKELEGATVERVYWAVPSTAWLPVIGRQFETFRDAQDYADSRLAEPPQSWTVIISRMVFRKPDGTTVDMEIGREKRFR